MNPVLDTITDQVKERALTFAKDNLFVFDSRDLLMIENAMLIGASIALQSQLENTNENQNHSQHSA